MSKAVFAINMDEIGEQRVSVAIHAAAGAVMGWVSIIITAMSRTLYAVILGLVVLYVIGFAVEKIVGKKGFKWWAGNGLFIYLFIWFIVWVLLFNL